MNSFIFSWYLVEEIEEPNAITLLEGLHTKAVAFVKGRDERKKKLQQVETKIDFIDWIFSFSLRIFSIV